MFLFYENLPALCSNRLVVFRENYDFLGTIALLGFLSLRFYLIYIYIYIYCLISALITKNNS